jgi:uncharacterized protein YxjI
MESIELEDNQYHVEQAWIRNKYQAYNSRDELVFKGKQKLFKMKEEFPFVDENGDELFRVEAGGYLDIAGDYTIIDDETDEPEAILDNQFNFFHHQWKIREPDSEDVVAEIESVNAIFMILRSLHWLLSIFPFEYEIRDANDQQIGTIEGHWSLKDKYDIELHPSTDVPKEPVLVAAMVIDAIEGN